MGMTRGAECVREMLIVIQFLMFYVSSHHISEPLNYLSDKSIHFGDYYYMWVVHSCTESINHV